MQRSKRIILISHCIINQNTVIPEEARALGAIPSAVEWLVKEGLGIMQLPCPEFSFLGFNRPAMTYEQYDTVEYRQHIQEILAPFVKQLVEYKNNGYEIVGMLGVQSSPSCDPTRGVFTEELERVLADVNIQLDTYWYLPNTDNPIFNSEHNRHPS